MKIIKCEVLRLKSTDKNAQKSVESLKSVITVFEKELLQNILGNY